MRTIYVILILCAIKTTSLLAQDTTYGDDPFNAAAFDSTVSAGATTDAKNKLEYLPGVFFVSEATGRLTAKDGSYGSDTRFYGKGYLKATKADLGSLFLGVNFQYFIYAAASNQFYRSYYEIQSPNPAKIAASLSEFHLSFDIRKLVFIRLGSQLLSWGATYFWSPEDFINLQKSQATVLSVVDIRTGKPGLRIHVPLQRQHMNVFLFTDFSNVVKKGTVGNLADSIAQAWRVDGTLHGVNIGTVGYISKNHPAQIGFDATGSVFGADVYGECALKFINKLKDSPDAAFSLGAAKAFGQEKTWTVRGEFYFNSQGYKDTDLSTLMPGAFTPLYSGKYYVYGELSTTKLFSQILGGSVFAYANLADRSYSSTLQLSFDIPRLLPIAVYGRYSGGRDNREFTNTFGGPVFTAGLRIQGDF